MSSNTMHWTVAACSRHAAVEQAGVANVAMELEFMRNKWEKNNERERDRRIARANLAYEWPRQSMLPLSYNAGIRKE